MRVGHILIAKSLYLTVVMMVAARLPLSLILVKWRGFRGRGRGGIGGRSKNSENSVGRRIPSSDANDPMGILLYRIFLLTLVGF